MPVSCQQINNRHEQELEYRRKWLYQLQVEFRQVCSWYRVSLAAPAFRISDSNEVLGAWHPETRTISLSSFLIHNYSWDAVINILKHEMAHQYVHEYLNRGMELPHGPAFQEACRKLGVMHPFNLAAGNTPKVFSAAGQAEDPEYERKVGKVKKMLSLAGSSNRYEAAAAMSKANSFMRRYNLERLESNSEQRYSYEIINTGKKRLQVIERRIAGLLMDYFYVDIVYSEMFDQQKLTAFKTIEMLGTRENVTIARHVYEFLHQRVDSLWRSYHKTGRIPGRLRKTYILGLLQGFREKLEKAEKKDNAAAKISEDQDVFKTISGLIVARDQGLAEYTSLRFPRLRKVRYQAAGISCRTTYSAGKAEGRKITIYKTVRDKDGNCGRLLGR